MKTYYAKPELDVIAFRVSDVIATSGEDDGEEWDSIPDNPKDFG